MAQGIHGIPLFGLEELHLTRLSRPCRTLCLHSLCIADGNSQCNLISFRFATVDLGGWDRLELTSPAPNTGDKVLQRNQKSSIKIK